MPDFQKTVNLKDKFESERKRMLGLEPEKKVKSKAEEIDEVYKPERKEGGNLRKINKPLLQKDYSSYYKKGAFVVLFIILIISGYFYFFHSRENNKTENQIDKSWYSIKLQNGEVYYGQIENTSADPVVIKNVYYDYDLINKTEKTEQTGLRLVKKGKETYGPAGVMEVVRSNVMYMDQLKADSKVLKAILDYENKNK